MHPSLAHLDHRPWPLPASPWRWRQAWLDLAFLHVRIDARQVQPLLPKGVRLQEFDGSAWLGLVPFRMAGVARRPLSFLPVTPSFPELNLRTYVDVGDKPGVWFFSLDASCRSVVWGGRELYNLPYHLARMRQTKTPDGGFVYESHRRAGSAVLRATYRPRGEPFLAAKGSFVHWASERYCLYSRSARGALARVEVHHAPWPLQEAEVEIQECGIFAAAGLTPDSTLPVCHYSRGVEVVSYEAETVSLRESLSRSR